MSAYNVSVCMGTPPHARCLTWFANNLLAFFSTKLLTVYGTGATFGVANGFRTVGAVRECVVCAWWSGGGGGDGVCVYVCDETIGGVCVCVCVCVCGLVCGLSDG